LHQSVCITRMWGIYLVGVSGGEELVETVSGSEGRS